MAIEHELKQEEIEAAFSGPAFAANRYLVFPSRGGIRLTFMEAHTSGVSEYRAAVIIPVSDVQIVLDLLREYVPPAVPEETKTNAQADDVQTDKDKPNV